MFWLALFLSFPVGVQYIEPLQADDYPDASAIYVLDSTRVIVAKDFGRKTYRHILMRVFTTRGRDKHGNFMQRYDRKKEQIHLTLTHTIKQNGDTIKPAEKGIGDVSTIKSFRAATYSDARLKTVAFSGVEPGDLLEYASTKITEPPKKEKVLSGSILFASDEPILHKVFILEVPEEMEVNYKISGNVKVETVRGEKSIIYCFSSDSVPRVKHEQYMLPLSASGPRVLYTTFNSWEEVGDWLRDQFEASIKLKGNLVKKAKELEKMDKIYQFVVSNWQDMSIGFEDIGFAPTKTNEIYENKYGSPLDKAALLIAMLREVGKEAYPAYLASQCLEKDVPAPFYFDGILVAVPYEGGYIFLDPVFPEMRYFRSMLSAILSDPPALEDISYPLPYNRGYGKCFIVKRDTSFFYTMPDTYSQSEVEANIAISPNGSIKGKICGTLRGIDAAYARRALRVKREKELKQTFEGYANTIQAGTKLLSWEVSNLENIIGAVELAMEFETPNYLVEQGREHRFPLLNNVFDRTPRAGYFGHEKREYPFTTLSPHLMKFTLKLAFPEGFEPAYMPDNFATENDLGISSFRITQEDSTLIYQLVWGFKKGIYKPEDYKGLEKIYRKFAKRRFIIFDMI